MSYTKRNCDFCGREYKADNRNLKRGWGLCCNKKCAAKLRERNKPTWNAKTVKKNNEKRENWNNIYVDSDGDYGDECSIDRYHDSIHPHSAEAFESGF